jgi:myosin heavy subunit
LRRTLIHRKTLPSVQHSVRMQSNRRSRLSFKKHETITYQSMKPLVVILALACVALAAQVFFRNSRGQQAERELSTVTLHAQALSNEVVEARGKLDEEARLAAYLQSNLTSRATDLAAASNSLNQSASVLASAQAELKNAQLEVQKQNARVAELEGQKDDMQSRLDQLAGSIKTLNGEIAETKRKLGAAEGDRASLSKELARLQSDKADLLRQFNDLAVLKAQVALLREEAAINQRLAWISQGIYQSSGRKGAEALVAKPGAPASSPNPTLNVDIHQNGRQASPAQK